MEHLPYEDRLGQLVLLILEKTPGTPHFNFFIPKRDLWKRWGQTFFQGLLEQDKG